MQAGYGSAGNRSAGFRPDGQTAQAAATHSDTETAPLHRGAVSICMKRNYVIKLISCKGKQPPPRLLESSPELVCVDFYFPIKFL